jgi:hypothetical protein
MSQSPCNGYPAGTGCPHDALRAPAKGYCTECDRKRQRMRYANNRTLAGQPYVPRSEQIVVAQPTVAEVKSEQKLHDLIEQGRALDGRNSANWTPQEQEAYAAYEQYESERLDMMYGRDS